MMSYNMTDTEKPEVNTSSEQQNGGSLYYKPVYSGSNNKNCKVKLEASIDKYLEIVVSPCVEMSAFTWLSIWRELDALGFDNPELGDNLSCNSRLHLKTGGSLLTSLLFRDKDEEKKQKRT
jgi:hypothetical protein